MEEYDVLTLLPSRSITNLLTHGYVELINVSPRLCPIDRTPEYMIVTAARVSYGNSQLKSIKEDENLLKFLYENQHSSPFEMIDFTFKLSTPIFVARQFMRHRTGSYNEKSARYTEDNNDFYYLPNPIRFSDPLNKQGSNLEYQQEQMDLAIQLYSEAKQHLDRLFEIYHSLIEIGVAKEIARVILPVGEFTEYYVKFNLRNLLHFLELRCDAKHAQHEIVVFANAMKELIRPLVPICVSMLSRDEQSVILYPEELIPIISDELIEEITSHTRSKLRKRNLADKLKQMKNG